MEIRVIHEVNSRMNHHEVNAHVVSLLSKIPLQEVWNMLFVFFYRKSLRS